MILKGKELEAMFWRPRGCSKSQNRGRLVKHILAMTLLEATDWHAAGLPLGVDAKGQGLPGGDYLKVIRKAAEGQ